MEAVAPYGLFFFEEPLHYTDLEGYVALCAATDVPIAGGECLTAGCEWEVFALRDAFDVGQPDAAWSGGMGEFVRVSHLLERRGRRVVTHCAGAGGAFMQNLHAGFACGNTAALEILPALRPLHTEIMAEPFQMEDGMALPPELPGLGLVLREETRARYPFVPGSGEFNSVPGKVMEEHRETFA
jgi:L-alanine-DL-glutamate epimerase-like enolase superfamily enzyme